MYVFISMTVPVSVSVYRYIWVVHPSGPTFSTFDVQKSHWDSRNTYGFKNTTFFSRVTPFFANPMRQKCKSVKVNIFEVLSQKCESVSHTFTLVAPRLRKSTLSHFYTFAPKCEPHFHTFCPKTSKIHTFTLLHFCPKV